MSDKIIAYRCCDCGSTRVEIEYSNGLSWDAEHQRWLPQEGDIIDSIWCDTCCDTVESLDALYADN